MVYYTLYLGFRLRELDSVVIHYPDSLPLWALVVVLPATFVSVIAFAGLHFYFSAENLAEGDRFVSFMQTALLLPRTLVRYRDLVPLSVAKVWIAIMATVYACLVMLPASVTFRLSAITPFIWHWRFAVISVQWQALPLLIFSLLNLFVFPLADEKMGIVDTAYDVMQRRERKKAA